MTESLLPIGLEAGAVVDGPCCRSQSKHRWHDEDAQNLLRSGEWLFEDVRGVVPVIQPHRLALSAFLPELLEPLLPLLLGDGRDLCRTLRVLFLVLDKPVPRARIPLLKSIEHGPLCQD
jgi:hypothetical protein